MYEKYKIENKRCSEILSTFKFKGISIKELNISEEVISFVAKAKEKKKIINVLKRYKIEILSVEKLTSYKIIEFFKERMILLILILIMIPSLYFNLSFLKHIEISGNDNISLDSIYVTLRENDVRIGMKLDLLNTGYLENKFYIKYDNLKFITFDLVGTNLYIEVIDYKNEK